MTISIFELASIQKTRFTTNRGVVSAEQLWDMKPTGKDGFDLNTVAKSVNAELKAAGEEDFVVTTTDPAKVSLTLKLDILKYIISIKLKAEADKASIIVKAQERAKLIGVLSKKQDEALDSLTEAEIQAKLAAL